MISRRAHAGRGGGPSRGCGGRGRDRSGGGSSSATEPRGCPGVLGELAGGVGERAAGTRGPGACRGNVLHGTGGNSAALHGGTSRGVRLRLRRLSRPSRSAAPRSCLASTRSARVSSSSAAAFIWRRRASGDSAWRAGGTCGGPRPGARCGDLGGVLGGGARGGGTGGGSRGMSASSRSFRTIARPAVVGGVIGIAAASAARSRYARSRSLPAITGLPAIGLALATASAGTAPVAASALPEAAVGAGASPWPGEAAPTGAAAGGSPPCGTSGALGPGRACKGCECVHVQGYGLLNQWRLAHPVMSPHMQSPGGTSCSHRQQAWPRCHITLYARAEHAGAPTLRFVIKNTGAPVDAAAASAARKPDRRGGGREAVPGKTATATGCKPHLRRGASTGPAAVERRRLGWQRRERGEHRIARRVHFTGARRARRLGQPRGCDGAWFDSPPQLPRARRKHSITRLAHHLSHCRAHDHNHEHRPSSSTYLVTIAASAPHHEHLITHLAHHLSHCPAHDGTHEHRSAIRGVGRGVLG